MSKIEEYFSANGRALFDSERHVVDAFNKKYSSMDHPDVEKYYPPKTKLEYYRRLLDNLKKRQEAVEAKIKELEKQ